MKASWLVFGIILAVSATFAVGQGHSHMQAAQPATAPNAGSRTNEDLQPTQLPPLPANVTIDAVVDGDRIFHSIGGCFACHGADGEGLPAAGSGITSGLAFVPVDVTAIAALVTRGLPDAFTRSPIAMPARGARGTLSATEIDHVAQYVWLISQVRGEPWQGGHASHFHLIPAGSTSGTASPDRPAPRHQ
jgi:mono/diheme cytochrome c family protein